jgi:hypothetical protein
LIEFFHDFFVLKGETIMVLYVALNPKATRSETEGFA